MATMQVHRRPRLNRDTRHGGSIGVGIIDLASMSIDLGQNTIAAQCNGGRAFTTCLHL